MKNDYGEKPRHLGSRNTPPNVKTVLLLFSLCIFLLGEFCFLSPVFVIVEGSSSSSGDHDFSGRHGRSAATTTTTRRPPTPRPLPISVRVRYLDPQRQVSPPPLQARHYVLGGHEIGRSLVHSSPSPSAFAIRGDGSRQTLASYETPGRSREEKKEGRDGGDQVVPEVPSSSSSPPTIPLTTPATAAASSSLASPSFSSSSSSSLAPGSLSGRRNEAYESSTSTGRSRRQRESEDEDEQIVPDGPSPPPSAPAFSSSSQSLPLSLHRSTSSSSSPFLPPLPPPGFRRPVLVSPGGRLSSRPTTSASSSSSPLSQAFSSFSPLASPQAHQAHGRLRRAPPSSPPPSLPSPRASRLRLGRARGDLVHSHRPPSYPSLAPLRPSSPPPPSSSFSSLSHLAPPPPVPPAPSPARLRPSLRGFQPLRPRRGNGRGRPPLPRPPFLAQETGGGETEGPSRYEPMASPHLPALVASYPADPSVRVPLANLFTLPFRNVRMVNSSVLSLQRVPSEGIVSQATVHSTVPLRRHPISERGIPVLSPDERLLLSASEGTMSRFFDRAVPAVMVHPPSPSSPPSSPSRSFLDDGLVLPFSEENT